MSKLKAKIVHDTKVVVFHPSPNRVTYPKDAGSPLLKRLAPRRPPLNPAPPEEDDDASSKTEDES